MRIALYDPLCNWCSVKLAVPLPFIILIMSAAPISFKIPNPGLQIRQILGPEKPIGDPDNKVHRTHNYAL